MSEFFYKPVNAEDRDAMITFLRKHTRYYTMNSWNLSTSYANNVNPGRLGIPRELYPKAIKVMTAEQSSPAWDNFIDRISGQFLTKTGYRIRFNSCHKGYLVLYHARYPDCPIDMDETFLDWDNDQLQKRVMLVQTFDRACDAIRDGFLTMLPGADVENREIVVRTVTTALVLQDPGVLDGISMSG